MNFNKQHWLSELLTIGMYILWAGVLNNHVGSQRALGMLVVLIVIDRVRIAINNNNTTTTITTTHDNEGI